MEEEAIAQYLIARAGSKGLLQTQFVKLLYLADVTAMKTFGHRLTGLSWIRYEYGPFTPEVYRLQERLHERGLAVIHQRTNVAGNPYAVIRSTHAAMEGDLPPPVRLVLDCVVKEYEGLPLRALLQAAYATEPMQNAEFGDSLDLSTAAPEGDFMTGQDLAWITGGTPWGE